MIEIKQLHGTEEELYRLVAPLVMNPAVLKQNYNFPFRTSERFEWFVGLDDEGQVVGFVPVECKRGEFVINNYYVQGRDQDVLAVLMTRVLDAFPDKCLVVISFREDEEMFGRMGFLLEKSWTRYVKMRKEPAHE